MLFSSRAPLSALIGWCRALNHGLKAGLSLVQVFRQQARSGPAALRPAADAIAGRMEKGDSLADALKPERHRFPPLFLELAGVAEKTGNVPEVFAELEDYYRLQQSTRRNFIAQIAWPVFQFVAAVGVIALLILVLGLIGGDKPLTPIGMGLSGPRGAVIFLLMVGTAILLVALAVRVVLRTQRLRSAAEGFLLRLPGIGPCLQAIAMQRFCMALRMTWEAGLPADRALRFSLRATANEAFSRHEGAVAADIKRGSEVVEALAPCGPVFPEGFLQALAVAETSGQIPEVMQRQSKYYREEVARRLGVLTVFASFAVWGFVALLLIVAIFRIASIYFGILNDFTKGI
jgi:type IV pilus assembly protein PilC